MPEVANTWPSVVPTFAFAKYVKVVVEGTVLTIKVPSARLNPKMLFDNAFIVTISPTIN